MEMQQLLVDGLAGNLYLLRHEADLCAYLRHLIEVVGMHLMAGPLSVQAAGFGPEAGVTAVAIISESHLAIHTWPERRDFNLNVDVFSCRPFPVDLVLEDLRECFQLRSYGWRIIQRPFSEGSCV